MTRGAVFTVFLLHVVKTSALDKAPRLGLKFSVIVNFDRFHILETKIPYTQ